MILALQGRGAVSPGQRFHDRAWGTLLLLVGVDLLGNKRKDRLSLRGERR